MILYPNKRTKIFAAREIKKQPPLRKIVYERLKSAILDGSIPKGTKLYETRIAEELEISRTPVREALHALERELLIVGINKAGYQVVDLGPQDLEVIAEVRKTVEALALEKAVNYLGDREMETLEDNLERSKKAVAGQKPVFVQLDAEFHKILCSLSRNERLIRMGDTLWKEMTGFRNRMKSNQVLARKALKYHQTIVNSLKMKDYSKAKEALIDHINHIQQVIQKEFDKRK